MKRFAIIIAAVASLAVVPAASASSVHKCGWVDYHSAYVMAGSHTSCSLARKVGWYVATHRFINRNISVVSPVNGRRYYLHLYSDTFNRSGHGVAVYTGRGDYGSTLAVGVGG
jgi:hypothetical protein